MENILTSLKTILSSPALLWLVYMGFCIALMGVELLKPAERGHSIRGRVRNVGYSLLFLLLGSVSLHLLLQLSGVFSREIQQPSGLAGSLLAVLFTLFIGDFIYYWYHRAQHKFSALWLVHELHHADEELNVTTSRRTYFLEKPLQFFFIVVPAVYIVESVPLFAFARMDLTAISIYPYVAIFWLVFAHANIRLPLGPFTILATGPQYHRIHHSIEPPHIDKNFAQFFPIFDKMFGTYYHPAPDEFPATGTPHLSSNASMSTTLIRPFQQWGILLSQLFRRSKETT